ncbi:hypothetical protein SSP531S_52380 [Streptomyces spongiicola]|uniref:Uncharacterized protein n=1 Tax=Streptomyces spongiicola TaxID=1690221 RepID=A0A388T6D3_9ACTN|nr:hypothetical protein SSP531S_52380 [Streptomyces spongiicola]
MSRSGWVPQEAAGAEASSGRDHRGVIDVWRLMRGDRRVVIDARRAEPVGCGPPGATGMAGETGVLGEAGETGATGTVPRRPRCGAGPGAVWESVSGAVRHALQQAPGELGHA